MQEFAKELRNCRMPYLKKNPNQEKAISHTTGPAMIIAGLVANGVTEIEEIERIDRGYVDVVEKFALLGADIKRIYTPDNVEVLKNA